MSYPRIQHSVTPTPHPTPSNQFAGTHSSVLLGRKSTVQVKCLTQEYNTVLLPPPTPPPVFNSPVPIPVYSWVEKVLCKLSVLPKNTTQCYPHPHPTPSIQFAGTHSSVLLGRKSTVQVKCLTQEYNTVLLPPPTPPPVFYSSVPINTPGWQEELCKLRVFPKNTTQCYPPPPLPPPAFNSPVSICTPEWKEALQFKCLAQEYKRTQHNVSGQYSNPDRSIRSLAH